MTGDWSDRNQPGDPEETDLAEDRYAEQFGWIGLGSTDEGIEERLEVDEDGLVTHTRIERYRPPKSGEPIKRPTEEGEQ